MKYIHYVFLGLIISYFGINRTFAQCSGSDVVVSNTGKCLPVLSRFIVSPALAKGSIYYWDIGDGNGPVFGSDTFYHQYTVAGNYSIIVTVIKPDGTKCIITKAKGFVSFTAPLNPGFYADQTKFCSLPAIISLHDTTKNVISREWYINGIKSPITTANTKITDSTPGNTSISLIVYDKNGCPQQAVKPNYIIVPQNIHIGFCSVLTENNTHTQISAEFKIGFDTTINNISEIDWSFPGGNPSTYKGSFPPLILYKDLSSYNNVTLTVKVSTGCQVTCTKKNLIGQYYSVAQPTVCANEKGIIKNMILYNPSLENPFFGAIANKIFRLLYIGNNEYSVKFYDTGVYNFKFPLFYFNSICNDTLIVPNLFTALPPLADFSYSPRAICSAPGKMILKALNWSPSGANVYTWEIFDSSMNQMPGSPIGPLSARDTAFIFSHSGVYSIGLIASNTNGCSDTILKPNILRVGTPDINYQLVHDTMCLGDTLYVNNLSKMHDPTGNQVNNTWLLYTWNFYNSSDTIISNYRSPRIVFKNPGVYNLYYTINSEYTCTSSRRVANALLVNGIKAGIIVNRNKTCPPATYNLSASISANVPGIIPLTYLWTVSPSAKVSIINPTGSGTDVTFSSQGYYNLTIRISNGICSTVVRKDSLIVGTVSDFNIDSFSCRNDPIHLVNLSSQNVNRYKWSILPSKGFIISSDTEKSPSIVFTSSGCFQVQLQTSDSSIPNCYDTFSRSICIYQPPIVNNVYSPDISSHCSPRVDSFYVNSINGKTFYWDFGDSNIVLSKDSQLTHSYFRNNSNGYTVKVVAIDSNGCASDTFKLLNYIKISGPEPSFSVISKPPCDSGTIYFVNNSKFVYNYYFIYGDNSSIDYNTIKPHFYQFGDYSKDSNIYNPTLFAYDETGCLASATAKIKLYRPPIVKIFSSDTAGCTPLNIQFKDSTKYAVKYKWDFGDGTNDTLFSPVHSFTNAVPPGTKYRVTLTAISDKGCTVVSSPLSIDVHPVITPTIKISVPKVQCYQDTFQFQAITASPVSRYHWDFGDGNLNSDTSALQDPQYHYLYPGHHKVKLTVFTAYGCSALTQDSTSVQNLDSSSPVSPVIDYITVTSSNQVKIVFDKSKSLKFDHYTLYRFPGPDSIYATGNIDDTVYFDNPPGINVNSQSYSYVLKLTDVCGFTSRFSIQQHSVFLTVNKYNKNGLVLSWNKYSGWDSVLNYLVYKMNAKGKFVLISTLSGFDSSYIDTNLCPGRVKYYVVAVHSNGKYFSISDTASNVPNYQYQASPIYLANATVINNKFVGITWEPSIQANIKFYSIDRYSLNSGWLLNFAATTNNSYIDSNVDVNKSGYIYRISVVDDCGDISPLSNIATSILLNGYILNDVRYLYWNSYSEWNKGISAYHVQLMQNNGRFKDIAILTPTDTSYFDSASHSDLDIQTCYRVYAIENTDLNGNSDTSISNIACPYLTPRIYIPNAFSPNGDSVNDLFMPKGLSIILNSELKGQKYEFKIYDKWGEMVFETSDFRKGWDGKYNGVKVPPDVYVYLLNAQGFNGQRFYMKGNVTVVK